MLKPNYIIITNYSWIEDFAKVVQHSDIAAHRATAKPLPWLHAKSE